MLKNLVLGGIYACIFTPTESAAVGAFGAYLFAILRGRLRSWPELLNAFAETVRTAAMIVAIVFCGMVMAQFINVTGMPFELVNFVGVDGGIDPIGLVLGICVIRVIIWISPSRRVFCRTELKAGLKVVRN